MSTAETLYPAKDQDAELSKFATTADYNEDFYPNYQLPDYGLDRETPSVVHLDPDVQDGYGIIYKDRWQMHDSAGTEYKVLRCISAKPNNLGRWVVKDTALGTQPEGLNTDVARKLMGFGFNVLIKGPEINSSLSQSHSAFNTHRLLDLYEREGDIDSSIIAIEGYSRGSMIGFGTIAYAADFGRQIIYANLTDPCIARPLAIDRDTLIKGFELPRDLGLLAVAVMFSAADIKRATHLRKTADLSSDGLRQFYRTLIPLLDGEAGKMATKVPQDLHATIAFFRHCSWNDQTIYRQILHDHKGVRFVNPEGGHGAAIHKKIIGNIALRFGRLANQLSEGRQLNEIDHQYINYGLSLVS